MKPKSLKWIWGDDKEEDFWSMLKDERERKLWLYQLYRERSFQRWVMIIFGITWFLIELGAKSNSFSPILVFVSVMLGAIYINAESKIRIIRLYELLSAKDKITNGSNS